MSLDPFAITIVNLPDGRVGFWYSATLTTNASNLGPLTWTILAGSLPAGLHMNPQGEISGTPTATANITLLVSVQDSSPTPQQLSTSVGLYIGAPVVDTSNPNAQFRNAAF